MPHLAFSHQYRPVFSTFMFYSHNYSLSSKLEADRRLCSFPATERSFLKCYHVPLCSICRMRSGGKRVLLPPITLSCLFSEEEEMGLQKQTGARSRWALPALERSLEFILRTAGSHPRVLGKGRKRSHFPLKTTHPAVWGTDWR